MIETIHRLLLSSEKNVAQKKKMLNVQINGLISLRLPVNNLRKVNESNPRLKVDARGLFWPHSPYPYTPIDPEEFLLAREFLAQCERSETDALGSLSLHAIIESVTNRPVSHGACLTAARELGFRIEPGFQEFSQKH